MENHQFKTAITSEHKLLDFHLKETWEYRDLIKLFVKRNFSAMYKQTRLGPLWAIINPILTTVVFTIVFGKIAKLTIADIDGNFVMPSFLFYMAGNICWNYFSGTLSSAAGTFRAHKRLMGKVYYPRLVSPIASAVTRLIPFAIQFCLMAVIWIVFYVRGGVSICVTPMVLMIPLIIIEMMLLALGCGMIVASCTIKYRDLGYIIGFLMQLWRYGSPIAYGLKLVPERFMGVYLLNPITHMVTAFRYAVFGFGYFDLGYYMISWAVTAVVLFIGLILFSKAERTFMDLI